MLGRQAVVEARQQGDTGGGEDAEQVNFSQWLCIGLHANGGICVYLYDVFVR
jgi:hypothetical protein